MTQQVTDPWAAAAGQNIAQPVSTQTHEQPAQTKDLGAITDPFGTASQVVTSSGATWDPRVPFDEIAGSTVIMVPRSFNPEAEDRFNPGKTREEYRVDIVILDGESFSFQYKSRDSKDAEPTEKTFEVKEFPAVFRQNSINQGQLIKLLKGIDAAPDKLFAIGVLLRVPQKQDLSAGYTIDSIEQSRQDYIKRVQATGKTEPDTRQRHSWFLVDDPKYLTPERMQRARVWWETAKTTWPNL